MSNKLRRASKGDKAPAVRRTEFNDAIKSLEQNMYHLHNALLENIYMTRYASANINHFISFLAKKGVIVDKEYREYVEEQNKKSKLAEEIRQDESLSREEKIAKAKENDIPEDWVTEPEQTETEKDAKEETVAISQE